MLLLSVLFVSLLALMPCLTQCWQKAKDNGNIYVVNESELINEWNSIRNKEPASNMREQKVIIYSHDLKDESNAILKECNSSFTIPMDYLTKGLSDEIDETVMCFLHCLYEKSSLMDDWQLNLERIRGIIRPLFNLTKTICHQE